MTDEELVLEFQNGYKAALDELIERKKNLVKYFANKYIGLSGKILSLDDLEQEAWIAFIHAVNSFNFREDEINNFSAFAGTIIARRILNVITINGNRTHKNYILGTSVDVRSLSNTIPGTDGVTIEETIADDKSEEPFLSVEDELYYKDLRKDIFQLLTDVFNDNIRKSLIIENYGLIGSPMMMKDLALKYNLSDSRVQSLIFDGIRIIRKSEAGQVFMLKYKNECIHQLELEKGSINQFSLPDVVITRMEIIDNLMNSILSKCEVVNA